MYPALVLILASVWKYRDDGSSMSRPVWVMLIVAQLLVVIVTAVGTGKVGRDRHPMCVAFYVVSASPLTTLCFHRTATVTYALVLPVAPVTAGYVLLTILTVLIVRWANNGFVCRQLPSYVVCPPALTHT